jgi:hypothetical protein
MMKRTPALFAACIFFSSLVWAQATTSHDQILEQLQAIRDAQQTIEKELRELKSSTHQSPSASTAPRSQAIDSGNSSKPRVGRRCSPSTPNVTAPSGTQPNSSSCRCRLNCTNGLSRHPTVPKPPEVRKDSRRCTTTTGTSRSKRI